MKRFRVVNFEKYQHYKDRRPPWIKLHVSTLSDYEFNELADEQKAHLMLIWLLASQMENKVPADADWIAGKVGAKSPIDLDILYRFRFIEDIMEQDASNALQLPEQNATESSVYMEHSRARGETETETETETDVCTEPDVEKRVLTSFIQLPTNKTGETVHITILEVEEWKETFPGVDVPAQLKRYKAHFDASPKKRKTARGMRKSIVYWLGRAQDNPQNGTSTTGRETPLGVAKVRPVNTLPPPKEMITKDEARANLGRIQEMVSDVAVKRGAVIDEGGGNFDPPPLPF